MQQDGHQFAPDYHSSISERVYKVEKDLAQLSEKLDEVLTILKASQVGLSFLRGLIYLGIAVATAWAAFRGVPHA